MTKQVQSHRTQDKHAKIDYISITSNKYMKIKIRNMLSFIMAKKNEWMLRLGINLTKRIGFRCWKLENADEGNHI